MLIMLGISMLLNIMGMAMQVVFYAACAYYIAKMGRKGWNAGK